MVKCTKYGQKIILLASKLNKTTKKSCSLKRKFVTNLILLVSLNLLIKPFWVLGIDRTVQNVVGAESYGLYFALFNFSMILNILLDVGITSFNNRNISQHRFLLHKHLSNIVGLKIVLAVVYAVFSLVIAAVIGYNKIQVHLLLFLIVNQFLISFTLYLRSNISALQLFRTDSLLSILDRTLMIIICSVLLFTNITGETFRIEWFVYAQTVAYVLTALITMLIVISKSGRITVRINRKFAMVFLKKSYPYALLILLMAFYNRIDSVMLERLLPDPTGKQEAGIYAQAFRLLDAVAMFGALVGGLLLPMFSSMIKRREPVGPIVNLAVVLLFVPSIIIAVSSLLYDRDIMALLYHSHVEDSADMLGLLMTGFIGIATTYIFGTLLTANGSIRELNFMAAGGMVLNVVLNLILIPKFFALGSAVASMVTQLATALTQVLIAAYIFKLRPGRIFVIKMSGFILAVILIGLLSRYIGNRALGYFGMIAASMLFAFFTGLINLRNLYQIIAYKE
jgi:O-antigen/teichoic acid export membrane protein